MSARAARRLASLLTRVAGIAVSVPYIRLERRYYVVWTDGPSEDDMYQLLADHAGEVPELDVHTLILSRNTSI